MCPECEAQKEGEDQRCSGVGAATTEIGSNNANVVMISEIFMFMILWEQVQRDVDGTISPKVCRVQSGRTPIMLMESLGVGRIASLPKVLNRLEIPTRLRQ